MSGPGEYRADCTEGNARVEDLPQALRIERSRNYAKRPCPACGRSSYRIRTVERKLHDLGDLVRERPRDLLLTYSQHHAAPVQQLLQRGHVRLGPAQEPLHPPGRGHGGATRRRGWLALPRGQLASVARSSRVCALRHDSKLGGGRGEKRRSNTCGEYLDGALADFSGYIAADELYDGPFCVLSIVDNRTFRRLIYQVLDHDPTHADILRFFRPSRRHCRRGLKLQGITTDGSPLYPEPISRGVRRRPPPNLRIPRHQGTDEGDLAGCGPGSQEVDGQKAQPAAGRPTTTAAPSGLPVVGSGSQQKVAKLFEHRHLFVQHDLTLAERRTLQHITRGQPQLRTLRDLMEEVYRLFDRRCRTDTALAKLAQLRQRVRRFKQVGKILNKLRSPNVDKALTFLDDKLLPSTSNAVERGNRRHRKMQKTVYRVRTRPHISSRIALDMEREERSTQCDLTTQALHRTRRKAAA